MEKLNKRHSRNSECLFILHKNVENIIFIFGGAVT